MYHKELLKYNDQYSAITKIGKRLKCLHIHDNNGHDDDHIAPFDGTVSWKDVMRGLKDAGYEHSFTFEAHNSVKRLPDNCKDDKIRFLLKVGEALVAMNNDL
jgi:sugar phosphate isomerase/epimerase